MARVDDFQQARDLAAQELANQKLAEIADRSGFETVGTDQLRIPFLDRVYTVSYPEFAFRDAYEASAEVPLQEQVLVLHYLLGCQPRLTGQWVAYREIPGAGFYYGPFVKRAIDPLKKVFGQNIAAMPLFNWMCCPTLRFKSSYGKAMTNSRRKPIFSSMRRSATTSHPKMLRGWAACRSIA